MMPKVVVDELFRLSGGRFSDRPPPERVPRSAAPPPAGVLLIRSA